MTVATTNTRELTLGQLVVQMYRRAGLLSVYGTLSQPQVSAGIDALELILKGLAAKGFLARKILWQTVTLHAGVWQYTMNSGTLDLIGTAMYADPTQPVTQFNTPDAVATTATSEIPVRRESRDLFTRLSARSATSRPTIYYPDRTGPNVIAYLWPVPGASEEGGHLRFQSHAWRADASDANTTADAERYWEQYLVWAGAHLLAVDSSLNLQRCAYLDNQARDALKEAKAMSYQGADMKVVVGHRTGWSR